MIRAGCWRCQLQRARAKTQYSAYSSKLGRAFWSWGNGEDEGEHQAKREKQTKGKPPGSDEAGSIQPGDASGASSGGGDEPGSPASPVTLGEGEQAPRYPTIIGLPIIRRPLFPGFPYPYTIKDPATIEAIVNATKEGQSYLGVFLKKDSASTWGQDHNHQTEYDEAEDKAPELITDINEIYNVGTFAQVHQIAPLFDGGGTQLLLYAHRRLRITDVTTTGPPLEVKVEHLAKGDSYDPDSDVVKAYYQEVLATLRDVMKLNPLIREHMALFRGRIDMQDPFRLADFAAAITTANGHEMQMVLEQMNVEERLRMALELLSKERELSKVQAEIQKQVEEKMSSTQRKMLLQAQLQNIKKELGLEKDDREQLLKTYAERLAGFEESLVPEVNQAIKNEMEKLSSLEKNSPEFNVTRSYLDWLTLLPWDTSSTENFDLAEANRILDEDHYGLEDIKERILEFIAVGKLKGSVHGKILCFVGPPGVGKTSIGKSIARALNRKFYRFSVGGLSDVSEIKGHRRTYVGAMPGKLIQCLKLSGTNNPLVLIDEIDKLGRGHTGDPASALLEVLDPSQNSTFTDHYLDVPVDLSNCLFICTANVMDTIPGPLQDRMEVIRLSGYDLPEKLAISDQYLIPKTMTENGLKDGETPDGLGISTEAVESLIRWYCREAGVRGLERQLGKICRKLALEVVKHNESGGEPPREGGWQVTPETLDKYVGKPLFQSDRLYEDDLPAGVVMGLAWTAMGGSSLYIETSAVATMKEGSGGHLKTTGQMGSVMQESTEIASHYARKKLLEVDPGNSYFDSHHVHIHVPEGSTPKDGPSAGVTLVTSLLSLAMSQPVRNDLAMTGELSLTGKVLPVGGIKEKAIAARRAGVKCLVFPAGNQRDYDELADYLKEGLEVHFANTYDDVFKVALSRKEGKHEEPPYE